MKWYFINESGEATGPISEDSLRELKATGVIRNDSQVCAEGTEEWMRLAVAVGEENFTPQVTTESIKFDCPHCHQRVSVGSGDAGLSFLCPTCGGAIQVPGVAAIPTDEIKPVKSGSSKAILFVAVGVAAVIIAGIIFMPSRTQEDRKGDSADQMNSSHRESAQGTSGDILQDRVNTKADVSGDIFQGRVSTKADVLGLRGGMSKVEAVTKLGLKELRAVPLTATNSATWIPGFQVFEFKPNESFPVKHVASIELVFLNDRLQSVCYNFKATECLVQKFKDGGRIYIGNSTRWTPSSSLGPAHKYERDNLVSDIRAAIKGNFDLLRSDYYPVKFYSFIEELYPDFSSGRILPRGGSYSEYNSEDKWEVNPIFCAVSSEIFVRFSGAVKNLNKIVSDFDYELNRPFMVRAERDTWEYFLLRFSFRNTYSESLAAGEAQLAMEANKAAEEAAKMNERKAAEKAAKDRAEEARIRKLKDGF